MPVKTHLFKVFSLTAFLIFISNSFVFGQVTSSTSSNETKTQTVEQIEANFNQITSDSEGRSERGHYLSDGDCVGFIAARRQKRRGDDRRNHLKRQRPAGRRSQRKTSGGTTSAHQNGYLTRAEQTRFGRFTSGSYRGFNLYIRRKRARGFPRGFARQSCAD